MQKLLSIGPTKVLLRSRHEGFWQCANRRYQNFIDGSGLPPDETVDLEVVADPGIPDHLAGSTSVRFLDHNTTVEMVRGRGVATWDRASRYCHIRQADADFLHLSDRPDYAVDSFIRIMLSIRLLEEQGCLVHSAGLVREGKGYLFVGKSGAGKSTVARLSAPMATVLSDDLTLVSLAEGGAQVHGTPFFGEFATDGAQVSASLQGIYFLRQATENRLTPLPEGKAVRGLLQSVLFFGQDKTSTQKVLDLLQALCQRTPCCTLDFVRDDSFWRLLHG